LTLGYGKHTITFEKDDYSKEEVKFEYTATNKKQYYMKVKLLSLNFLLSEGIELSKLKRFDDVDKLIKKLEEINPDDESIFYLKATNFYNKNLINEAMILFENLVERDRKNVYYQLPLINIYEKMQLYQKEAETCYYVGNNYQDDYPELLKKSAEIYRDKLDDNLMYENIINQYDKLLKKKE
jgi:tetratricopeptide (TPR) repeat protein